MANRQTDRRRWALPWFLAYCAGMLWLLLVHDRIAIDLETPYFEQLRQNCSLTPFHTIGVCLRLLRTETRGPLFQYAATNFYGNILAVIPWGILLPAAFPRFRRFWLFILFTALVIAGVEAVQLFTLLGSCDVDDLLLNLLGAAAGYGVYRLCPWRAAASGR